ncbi:MAG: rod shape-determining protein MreD, partial [Thiogranum sp.]
LTQRLHLRIRLFPLLQQAFTVMVLLILHQLLALWISRIIGRPGVPWYFWTPSLLGMLLWPFIYVLLRNMRYRFHVR